MDSLAKIFDFIGSIFDTIVSGINGCVQIITSIVNLVLSIFKILPSPLYDCGIVFVGLFLSIFIYKIFRKG